MKEICENETMLKRLMENSVARKHEYFNELKINDLETERKLKDEK